MKKNENDKLTREASVLLENVDFHVLISFPYWSKGERPMHETLLHKHVFYEFFVCKQGEISIKTAEGDILLCSGDIAIIPPTKSHVLRYVAENAEGHIIPFTCKKVSGDNHIDVFKKLKPIMDDEIHIFNNCPEYIIETQSIVEESFDGRAEKFLTALRFLEMLFKIVKVKTEEYSEIDVKKNGDASNDIERMMRLDSMIANRYLQKFTAADYANELFISTRQLDRIAIKRYGKSIHQLIVDRRFTLAEQLLSTTDLTVEDIASRSGFSSSASLYREFKKRTGITPAVYRKV